MARRSPQQIYADLVAVGFSPAAAVTMTQIALGESGGRVDALGDRNLQDATWGPSVGIYQIRTLKAETGKGTDRDILALQGDPARQALAAYRISGRGRTFTPWTVYTTGKYQQFASQVAAALGDVAGVGVTAVAGLGGAAVGATTSAARKALSGTRGLVLTGLFVAAGLLLIGLGAARSVAPYRERAKAIATKVAGAMR